MNEAQASSPFRALVIAVCWPFRSATTAKRREKQDMLDVVIVGGGPAGLSAALILGRCRRSVLLCDDGQPRNAVATAIHGFLTRDGIPPAELRRIAREQLRPYESVTLRDIAVTGAEKVEDHFEVALADGSRVACRKLLLATGVVDDLPAVAGAEEYYGRGIHHCPYCDGWEHRDAPTAIYGKGERGVGLALELTAWTRDIVLCTDGPAGLDEKQRYRLERARIGLREERIQRFEGEGGAFARIVFVAGETLPRRALFFGMGELQRSNLPARLGCEFTSDGAIKTGQHESTCVPGLYVTGDASRRAQLVVIAAAEGAAAAFDINMALLKADLAAG